MKYFRNASNSDIEKIMELEDACFNKYTREKKEVYLERINTFPDGFIVMQNKSEFIGAVSSEIWRYTPYINREIFNLGHSIKETNKPNGNGLYISSIGIFPKYRNHGFGEELFLALIKNIKLKYPNVIYVILLLNEEWKCAKKMYQRNGFKKEYILDGFFTSDDGTKKNGIVMRRNSL
jgi:ribosomal-protein-alanine N-acetyltransferase